MGHTDHELRLAYREVMRGLRGARARDEWIESESERIARLLATKPLTQIPTAYTYGIGTAPAGFELAAWLQQQDDPDGMIAEALFLPEFRATVCKRFAQAYAEARAAAQERRGRDWGAEASEQAAWENGGMV